MRVLKGLNEILRCIKHLVGCLGNSKYLLCSKCYCYYSYLDRCTSILRGITKKYQEAMGAPGSVTGPVGETVGAWQVLGLRVGSGLEGGCDTQQERQLTMGLGMQKDPLGLWMQKSGT